MLYHYVQIALRRIWHKRGLSLLKIAGLGLSIAASIWLIRYVEYQWQFDQFQVNREHIFRIQHDQYSEGSIKQQSAMTAAGVAVVLKDLSPAVLDYVRLGRWIANDVVFQYDGAAIRDKDFFFADPSFFDVFSFELLKGDPKTALEAPYSLILSEKNAKALFGEVDPIGKEVQFEGRKLFTVTGVSKDVPAQSQLHYGILASYTTTQQMGLGIYGNDHLDYFYVYAYVLLQEGANPTALAQQLTKWVNDRKQNPLIKDAFSLQPLTDIHLYSNLQFELGPTGNGKNLWVLFGISLLTLLLAWVNHFNLYTASAMDQLKAMGIRKVVGATRVQLIGQLAMESFIFSALGIGMGIVLAKVMETFVATAFNIHLANIQWQDLQWGNPVLGLSLAILGGALMSILIPAYILSSFRPVHILNKTFKLPGIGINVQKTLIVMQFAIIIGLLVASIVIYQQTQFMQKKSPGIALEDKLILRGPLGNVHYENLLPYYTQFKNTVEAFPEVRNLSLSREIPGNQMELLQNVKVEGKTSPATFNRLTVDHHFFENYELELISGSIPKSLPQIDKKLVINEAALALLGFPNAQAAIHKKLSYFDWEFEIMAVVKNHHHRSLHHPLVPIIFDFFNDPSEDGYFTLSMNEKINSKTIAKIKAAYTAAFPNTVFDFFELADHYQAQYQSDIDFKRLNFSFTLLGFFIACLGLFGLSLMVFEKRIKEIGIRKVLGASISSIVALLVSGLLRLVVIGLLIATPLSWYLLNQWLSNFAFHIHIGWWVFALAGSLALLVAFLTMSMQSVKAALTNPIDVLRRE
ncbi:MAG: FtsX-like permease family protein [Saprospiraceae bacterium]